MSLDDNDDVVARLHDGEVVGRLRAAAHGASHPHGSTPPRCSPPRGGR
jgi:hypothetical protein